MIHYIKDLFTGKDINSDKSPHSKETLESLWRLEKIILDSLDFSQTVQKIVDSVLIELGYLKLGYRIVVLALVNNEKNTLERISISQTEEARKALEVTPVPFHEIVIPLSETENYCIKSLNTNTSQTTHDWYDILRPAYTKDEARKVQEVVGIKTSMVFPVIYHGKTQGIIIFSMIKDQSEVSAAEKDLIQSFTDVVGLAVQNSRLYTNLERKTQDLDQANKKLQELDKLKDEFVSLASHELRTPMTAIRGSISTILEGYAGDISDQAREFLTAAYNENDRLIRLVNNLLNISRIEAGRLKFEYKPVQMKKAIEDVIRNMNMAAKEKGIYIKDESVSVPVVRADEDRIKEVLINLIGNAIKHTYEGGVTVSCFESDGKVVVAIKDTGHGIAKEDHELLFQKFSQVQNTMNKETGGTGLGLFISKQIIQGHKGTIWFESELGKGSTFYFSLPIVS